MPPDAPEVRQFVVAAYQDARRRRRELRQVQATSHEEAVALVAASRALVEGGAVYEAWPAQENNCVLRVTLEPYGPRRDISV